MATSPINSLDPHDWKRVGELLGQGVLSVVLTNLLALLPMFAWGKYQPIEMILIMALTEATKRFVQSPTPPTV
jgi:hypothetical protein